MIKKIVDNTSPEARQRQLEAKVQVAWAKAAGSMLHFCTGTQRGDCILAMKEFVEVYENAKEQNIDPKGVPIRAPDLDHDEDEHINAILRGSLRMVAAMLATDAEIPLPDRGGVAPEKSEAYNAALDEISIGVMAFHKRMMKLKRGTTK